MKIGKKIDQFRIAYEILVEYYMNRHYRVPDFLYKDMVQLVLMLDMQGINIHTFLIANFRMYEKFDDRVSYPYIRVLLNNSRSVRLYEDHHRVHGNKIGLVNYSRIIETLKDMRTASEVWLSMEGFSLEEKIRVYLVKAPDVFKHYTVASNTEIRFNLTFEKYETLDEIVKVTPFSVLEKIFISEVHKSKKLRQEK